MKATLLALSKLVRLAARLVDLELAEAPPEQDSPEGQLVLALDELADGLRRWSNGVE